MFGPVEMVELNATIEIRARSIKQKQNLIIYICPTENIPTSNKNDILVRFIVGDIRGRDKFTFEVNVAMNHEDVNSLHADTCPEKNRKVSNSILFDELVLINIFLPSYRLLSKL